MTIADGDGGTDVKRSLYARMFSPGSKSRDFIGKETNFIRCLVCFDDGGGDVYDSGVEKEWKKGGCLMMMDDNGLSKISMPRPLLTIANLWTSRRLS